MGFVRTHGRVRIQKRAAALKGRPAWQDVVLPDAEAREAWKIAGKLQKNLSRAFLQAMKDLVSEADRKDFERAWKSGSITTALNSLPLFKEGGESEVWSRLSESVGKAYGEIMRQSGEEATRRINKKFGTNLGFSVEGIKKAKKKIPTVPVNPYATQWIRENSLRLVKQTVSDSQKEMIRGLLAEGFEKGLRAGEVFDKIKANIGLTERQSKAVSNREALLERQGYSKEDAERMAEDYREELRAYRAETISRTETIAAQAAGRNEAWELAAESGELPPVERVWVAAPESPNPNRPCEICNGEEGLDGERAPLGEPYHSPIIGDVMSPPAHPDCRCTEFLERAKGA